MNNIYKQAMINKAKNLAIGGNKVDNIKIHSLIDNPYQPRLEIRENELRELAESIKEQGLLQPIIVTPKNDNYIIIAGHRRVAAHKLLGKQEIKTIVLNNLTDKDLMAFSITENLQRKNLNIIETAIALKEYKIKLNKSFSDIAKELGKTKTYIIHLINVLKLPEEIIEDIKINRSTTDVKALNMLNTLKDKLSVVLTTDEVKETQIRLYEILLEKGREELKQEIDKLLNSQKTNNYNIKKTNKGISLEIYQKLSKKELEELENFINNLIKSKNETNI